MPKIHRDRPPTQKPTVDDELAPGAPGPAASLSAHGDGLSPGPDYSSRTVVELRQLLRKRNETRPDGEQLALSGNKPDLIARLQADDG